MPNFYRPCVLACLFFAACSPALNWREITLQDTSITALLPCKPDASRRKIKLAGQDVDMFMQSCQADGATFAVAHVSLPDTGQVPAALAHWQRATWAHVAVMSPTPNLIPSLLQESAAAGPRTWWLGKGQRSNGEAVEVSAVWVVQGRSLVQAAIYAPLSQSRWREPFFDGLKL